MAKKRALSLLRSVGGLLIYPEGAWNITENEIVMPLYTGTAEMAIKTGAEIVPMAIERYGERYMVAIGKNISVYGSDIEEKYQLTNQLRDVLVDLKWMIWKNEGVCSGKEIPEWFLNVYFMEEIMREKIHRI